MNLKGKSRDTFELILIQLYVPVKGISEVEMIDFYEELKRAVGEL